MFRITNKLLRSRLPLQFMRNLSVNPPKTEIAAHVEFLEKKNQLLHNIQSLINALGSLGSQGDAHKIKMSDLQVTEYRLTKTHTKQKFEKFLLETDIEKKIFQTKQALIQPKNNSRMFAANALEMLRDRPVPFLPAEPEELKKVKKCLLACIFEFKSLLMSTNSAGPELITGFNMSQLALEISYCRAKDDLMKIVSNHQLFQNPELDFGIAGDFSTFEKLEAVVDKWIANKQNAAMAAPRFDS